MGKWTNALKKAKVTETVMKRYGFAAPRFQTTVLAAVFFTATLLLASIATPLAAQDDKWQVPRMADGTPDLQGVWANNAATPLERPQEWEGKENLSDAELEELKRAAREATEGVDDALFGDQLVRAAIAKTKAKSYDPTTGNYNEFWIVERNFENRTSLIVDPPDGRIPPLTPKAQERLAARRAYLAEHPADSWEDRGLGRALHQLWLASSWRRLQQLLPDRAVTGHRRHPHGGPFTTCASFPPMTVPT